MPAAAQLPGAKGSPILGPPKPAMRPWITVPDIHPSRPAGITADTMQAWRGLWHELGHNLPWYINHSRKIRRGLRAFGSTHGK